MRATRSSQPTLLGRSRCGAVLPPGLPDERLELAVDLGGEGALPDARGVGLGDPHHVPERGGWDPQAGGDVAREGVGPRDVGVGPVDEVEEYALGALEEDGVPRLVGLHDLLADVADDPLERGLRGFGPAFHRGELLHERPVERERGPQVEGAPLEVPRPRGEAERPHRVRWAYPPLRGPDGLVPPELLDERVHLLLQRGDDGAPPVDEEVRLVPLPLYHLDLLLERLRVDGHSRPYEEALPLQEARGEEVEDVRLLPDHDGVPSVAAAVVADDRVKPVSVVVYYLPFAFVSPLEAHDAKVPQTAPSSLSRI